jgi:hypothetical protein
VRLLLLTLRAVAIGLAAVTLLGAAGYGFVVKSFPYQTPQLVPPRVVLTAQEISDFAVYPAGLAEVPVLTWRDVSRRQGTLVTTPSQFAVELALLRRDGFRSISPARLAAVASGRPTSLPSRPVVLAFDAGLATDWTTVDPILRKYGFTAVVFVDPADVAVKSPSYYLTRAELSAMVTSGRWSVGVQLTGGWPSQAAAAAAVDHAKTQVQRFTGRPVTAYAWPAVRVPTLSSQRAPDVFNLTVRRDFAEVLGRAGGGPANFVVAGSDRGPLPRVSIASADTVRTLSLRLRTGVQAPPPADPLTVPWRSAGGTCRSSGGTVEVTARHFALCSPAVNGSKWQNYEVRFGLEAAHPGTTAIIELRIGASGRIEVAIGRSGLSIKQQVGRRWSVLRQILVQPVAVTGRTVPFLGSARLQVTLRLAGSTLAIRIGSLAVSQHVSSKVGRGIIALGLESPGIRAAIRYIRPAMLTRS